MMDLTKRIIRENVNGIHKEHYWADPRTLNELNM